EILQREREDWIQPRARVEDVEIERRQLVPEVQLRVVVERPAHVISQLLIDRPANHVAHCVKIKMKVERDVIIETDAFVGDRVAADKSKTERDDPALDSPDEKSRPFRHFFRDADKKLFTEIFKLHRRTFVDLKVKGINLIDERRDIRHHFHVDLRVAFGLPEFSAQTLPTDVTERSQILVDIFE